MADVGCPTDLTEEVFAKIKLAVFKGGYLYDYANASKIPLSTFYTWHSDNYLNIADKIEGWRRDSKLELADVNIDTILRLDPRDTDFTRAVLEVSKFVKETLDKPNYAKRTEVTGGGGGAVQVNIVAYADPNAPVQLSAEAVSTALIESNG